jgi:hypothetical protein
MQIFKAITKSALRAIFFKTIFAQNESYLGEKRLFFSDSP